MGSKFDSHWRHNRFDTLYRKDPFDTFGIPEKTPILCAVGSLLTWNGGTKQGALWYDFRTGVWSRFASTTFAGGSYSVSIVDGAAYICAAESTPVNLYKYQNGVLTNLGRVPSSLEAIYKVVAYGTGILCVGFLTSFTPTGGSSISTKGGIYFDGTNWNALGTALPEGLNIKDVVVIDGVAYAADSLYNYGCVKLVGSNWVAMNNGLQWAGADANCIAYFGGELYLGGELYTTGWVKNTVVKWNGSSWVGVSSPSATFYPNAFTTTPTKLIATGLDYPNGKVYEYNGSWTEISGVLGSYCAEKDSAEELYFASANLSGAGGGGVFKRESGAWEELGDVVYAERLAYGIV